MNDRSYCYNHDLIPVVRHFPVVVDDQWRQSKTLTAIERLVMVLVVGWSTDWMRRTSIAMVTVLHSSTLTLMTMMVKCSRSFADTNAADS